MTISLLHKFVSAKVDVGDPSVVKPTAWNEQHELRVGEGQLVGRKRGAGAGLAEEIPIAVDGTVKVDFSGFSGGLTLPGGPTAARPAPPVAGTMRWNSDTSRAEVWNGTAWSTVAFGDTIPTGSWTFTFRTDAPTGWILMIGSVGSASSGATWHRDECRALFDLWWGFDPATFPMGDAGARGASRDTDWAAARTIVMPDMREMVFALSGNILGTSPPNRLGLGLFGGYPVGGATLFAQAGEGGHTLTVAELATHNHGFTGGSPSAQPLSDIAGGATGSKTGTGSNLFTVAQTGDAGSSAAHNVVQPTVMMNALVKL